MLWGEEEEKLKFSSRRWFPLNGCFCVSLKKKYPVCRYKKKHTHTHIYTHIHTDIYIKRESNTLPKKRSAPAAALLFTSFHSIVNLWWKAGRHNPCQLCDVLCAPLFFLSHHTGLLGALHVHTATVWKTPPVFIYLFNINTQHGKYSKYIKCNCGRRSQILYLSNTSM